jgi:hypothetical protein
MTETIVSVRHDLTVAYIAIGVSAALRRGWKAEVATGIPMCVPDGGELELVADVIQHAALLDQLYEKHAEAFVGVFVYDIAEPFGEQYTAALLRGVRLDAGQLAARLIAAECVKDNPVETPPAA